MFPISPQPGPSGPKSLRQVTLAEHFTLAFNTNGIYKNAIILGDVDNDQHGDVELVLGSASGELGIFKAQRKRPWKKCSGLGAIMCLAVGDLMHVGKNCLVVISAEGHVYIFDVPPDESDWRGGAPLSPSHPDDLLDAKSSTPTKKNKQQQKQQTKDHLVQNTSSSTDNNPAEPASTTTLPAPVPQRRSVGPDGAIPNSFDLSSLNLSELDHQHQQGDSTDSLGLVPPKSAQKAAKTGAPLSFYSSIQTEKLAALASARSQSAMGGAVEPAAPEKAAALEKMARSETHSGIATSLLEQFKRTTTPSPVEIPVKSLTPTPTNHGVAAATTNSSSTAGSATTPASPSRTNTTWKRSTDKIDPIYRFFIEPNPNCAIIGDLDEDGKQELIIGSNNRAIYSYEFVRGDESTQQMPTLKLKSRWHLASQVNSLCLTADKWGRPVLVAGLQGGMFALVDHTNELSYRQFGVPPGSAYKPHHIRDDRTGPGEIVSVQKKSIDSSGQTKTKQYLVMSSLEGFVRMEDADITTAPQSQSSKTQKDRINSGQPSPSPFIWDLFLDNHIMAAKPVDVTGDGSHELVISALDGSTYIVDQDRNAVKFRFEDRVRAFTAGHYSVAPGKQRPCLIYVTFNDEILVYHKLGIRTVPIPSLYSLVRHKAKKLAPLLHAHSEKEVCSLVHAVLYDNMFDEAVFQEYKQKLLQQREEKRKEAAQYAQAASTAPDASVSAL